MKTQTDLEDRIGLENAIDQINLTIEQLSSKETAKTNKNMILKERIISFIFGFFAGILFLIALAYL